MRAASPSGRTATSSATKWGSASPKSAGSGARACAKAGLVDLHFHDLCREFACRLLESGADLHDVRDFLSHGNITTTSSYLRSTPLRLARALTLLEAGPRLFPT